MKVAILGLGVVGSGVYKQLVENKDKFKLDSGIEFELSYGVARTINEERKETFKLLELTDDVQIPLDDVSVDCIIEVMGGVELGYEVIKKALLNKKHVVTANKDLMAVHGKELIQLAKKQNCDLYFEGSVAGGLPILRSIYKGLASDHLYEFSGILNGTSNFILTKMAKEGLSYDEALKQAQALGFAESDPTADVEGHDAAIKAAILAMLCFSVDAKFEDVKMQGITKISSEAIEYANSLDCTIKLIGKGSYQDNKVSINVHPTFISNKHPLANVNNEMNSVYVKGALVGDIMIYGAGAGSNPTGTAVMSDVLEVAKNKRDNCSGRDLVIPYNEKNIAFNETIQQYLFIANQAILDEIKTKVNVTSQTNNYLIIEAKEEAVYQLLNDYDVQMYMIINEL